MLDLYYSNACKCGCGGKIEIRKSHKYDGIPKYINGHNKSNYRHGGKGTKLYHVWESIKERCLNVKSKAYKYYGDRGISICNEWLNFIPFRDWSLANGYADDLEIDRENNDLGYTPENCRWVTTKVNNRNRRNIKLSLEKANEIRFKYNSGYYTQTQLAKEYNVPKPSICKIINNKTWI